nr:MAG TPA: Glycine rich protein family [Caudoviricetes sp.]
MRKEGQGGPKKPVYKRVLFWVLVVVVVFFIAVMATPLPEDSGTEQEEQSAAVEQQKEETTEPAEEEAPAVDAPEVAKDLDSKYCTYVRMSNNCLKGVLDEDNDPATTYTKCTKSKDFFMQAQEKISAARTDAIKDVADCAEAIVQCMYSACGNIQKYLDDGKTRDLSAAQTDIQDMNTLKTEFETRRQAYMEKCGIGDQYEPLNYDYE